MNTDFIKQMQRKRLLFMQTLYEETKGDSLISANIWQLGEKLGFSQEETNLIDDYLSNQGFISRVAFGGTISITSKGVSYIEGELLSSEKNKNDISIGGNVSKSNIVSGNNNIIINIEQHTQKKDDET